jgi:hypothetical protein
LPKNVLWWRLDYTGRYYVEVLIREWNEDADGVETEQFRHWTYEDWTLYDLDGDIVSEGAHHFGVVPIVRLFDRRNLSEDHTAASRVWGIADKSRAYYNEESELVANNTMHNCPILQGPDTGDDDESVPINRYYMLKKLADQNGNIVEYSYLSPPTETTKFMRMRLYDLQDRMERDAALTRSVGGVATESAAGPVAQSGISKAYDQVEGSEYLASIAKTLQSAEYTILYFALIVLNDGFNRTDAADIALISSVYPSEFNLLSFDQYSIIVTTMNEYIDAGLGRIPTDEKITLKAFVGMKHPDLPMDERQQIEEEIDNLVDEAVKSRKAQANRPAPTPIMGKNVGTGNGQGVGKAGLIDAAG